MLSAAPVAFSWLVHSLFMPFSLSPWRQIHLVLPDTHQPPHLVLAAFCFSVQFQMAHLPASYFPSGPLSLAPGHHILLETAASWFIWWQFLCSLSLVYAILYTVVATQYSLQFKALFQAIFKIFHALSSTSILPATYPMSSMIAILGSVLSTSHPPILAVLPRADISQT